MIDEKKLIEEIEKLDLHGRMREYAGLCAAVDIIKNQPKVGDWIPCSERFLDERGTYIVNAIENHIVHVTFAKWMPRMKKWNLTGSRSYWKITAWQSLPEPFQR